MIPRPRRPARLLPAVPALLLAGAVSSGAVEPSSLRTGLLPAPPGVFAGGLAGVENPAAWALGEGVLDFAWDEGRLDEWTLALGAPVGFAVTRRPAVWRYQAGFAGGGGGWSGGLAWRWSAGDDGLPLSESGLVSGIIVRPNRYLSVGESGFLSAESRRRGALLEVGLRPLGTPTVALFADYSVEGGPAPADADRWSAGAEWRPWRGIHLGARVREVPGDDPEITANVGLTLDGLGYHELPRFDADGRHAGTRRIVRLNPPHRGMPVTRWMESRHPRRIVKVDLEHRSVGYRKDRWFDDDRVAWLDLVRTLRRVRDDPAAAGVALNLSSTRLRPAIVWELRAELAAIRAAGKVVLVQADDLRMSRLYLASVADRVQVDPRGWVELAGVSAKRTYWKGLLDKAGVGFEELRYFTYKSAMERYSRRDLSDVDREQLGRFVDVVHSELVDGIAEGRGLPEEEVVRLGEDEGILAAEGAREAGLVDGTGTWEDLSDWVRQQGWSLRPELPARPEPEERWGPPPVIALVYASGASAMDEGFRGRATGKYLAGLAKRRDVAAVVLRADSPGGDPMAAERIARGMAALRGKGTPVLASQGDVAASAGYSICLESDRIYTTPLTITGSIGVISGWAWDAGLGEKTGFSADGVQRGSHADLFNGIRFPFLPGFLPQRPLTDRERAIVRDRILAEYDVFVGEVARGRDLPEEDVRRIAEGRIWVGGDARERGLVDETGTLGDALDDALARAGLGPDDVYVIEEYPRRALFRLPDVLPDWPSLSLLAGGPDRDGEASDGDDPLLPLRMLLAHPGEPCRLAPLDALPAGWLDAR